MNKKKSQSILDFILAFVAVAALSIGIVRIWIWFNANYAKRQVAFQNSRLIAAIPREHYDQPIDIGANETCPDCTYSPMDLDDEWVFSATARDTVTGAQGSLPPGFSPDLLCIVWPEHCLGQPGCGDTKEEFNYECLCYLKCYCLYKTQTTRSTYNNQAQQLDNQAQMLKKNAESMWDTAKKCSKPWEICMWTSLFSNTWKKTKNELKVAAAKLDRTGYFGGAAQRLNRQADLLRKRATQIGADCCNEQTLKEQQDCFDNIDRKAECESCCYADATEFGDACRLVCDSGGSTQDRYNAWLACIGVCETIKSTCLAACNNLTGPEKTQCISNCNSAYSTCKDNCNDASDRALSKDYDDWLNCTRGCDKDEYSLWSECYTPCAYGSGNKCFTPSKEEEEEEEDRDRDRDRDRERERKK